uniref:Glycosyltransferase n=1 Tax=viral metagenome TaxID=1070528 RepID=A0A6C0JJR3_9ZZZZ
MNCIAVLTRGYNNYNEYSMLIKRNKHIEIHLNNKSTDVLIFHEGNISNEHQIKISNETPLLNIKFINISGKAFKPEKSNIVFDANTRMFGLSYRHMCSFWFVDFWEFVKDYEYLLRIDEDCFIDCSIDDIFLKLVSGNLFVVGTYSHDEHFVTRGLNDFSIQFMNHYSINVNGENYKFNRRDPSGPYTNLFGISLKIRNNDLFRKYVKEVDISNKIYERRWGDLPLWGEVIDYIFGKDTLLIDKTIKYYHDSHHTQVN